MTSTPAKVDCRSAEILATDRHVLARRTDRLFAGLMVFQYLAGVAAAHWVSSWAWAGSDTSDELHLWAARVLGAAIAGLPIVLALLMPGHVLTRHVIAIGQALTSALLIHLCGGRIETHFHVFGSLAFLSFYRDWRVLVTASVVVALDHFVREVTWPQSVFGTLATTEWRWLEHTAWVVFEDVFLIHACVVGQRDMIANANRRARLEIQRDLVEAEVGARSQALEAAMRQRERAEQFSQAVLQSTGDSIIVVGDDGCVLSASPSTVRATGHDLVGHGSAMLLPDHARAAHADLVSYYVAAEDGGGLGSLKRLVLQHRTGDPVPVEIVVTKVQGVDPPTFVAVVRDLSSRLQMERELEGARRLEAVGQLAAGIAHEINTPIQFVGDNLRFLDTSFQELAPLLAGLSERVRRSDPAPDPIVSAVAGVDLDYLVAEVPAAISQSLHGVERVRKIVLSMKEFSHPGVEGMTNVDLNHAIEATIVVATNEWKYVAEMDAQLDPDLPPVPCLPGEINQVLLNLIVNAAHAIADVVGDGANGKGRITITTRAIDGAVEIRIADTGTGIPEHARDRIFEPFFTTKEVGKGTGQGLAIARNIVVQQHGGSIRFETENGVGTTFVITLPLAREAVAEEMACDAR